ncbi:ATPase [Lentibacillus kapialis]|uniref:histidine kinase n=1 Tax=Lentibacillus kapialis TaxID=340214 RepID=A0A917PZQ6_9BACI|nr:HAMP domain-containing sensor histidine kinase [Lentibacillus kapialis]GGK01405.1 ATPase [Lentibacillus kapialis]
MVMVNIKKYLIFGCIGFLLTAYGFLVPILYDNWSVYINDHIYNSIIQKDSGLLLITTFVYIAKYLMTFFFIYFGSAILANTLTKRINTVMFSISLIVLLFLTLIFYNLLFQEHFSYTGHLFAAGIIILLQLYIPKQKHYYIIFSIILFLVLLAIQWLYLIPAFTVLGFGTNDLAASIKMADQFLTGNSLLNTIATIFFIVFLTIAIIFTILIHLLNRQLDTLKKYHLQGKELKETRTALIESKVYEEISMLVHDIKTPLVTVEGLVSLIELKLQTENRTLRPYFARVDHSLKKMNDMISEILYENNKQALTVNKLIEYVTSHLNIDNQLIKLRIDIDENLPPIHVNKIRFSRAISNILENAISSFAEKKGFIHINVKKIDKGILFCIKDNGPGIQAEHLKDIWQAGFSTKNSSGIGLSFVKRVIENHHGHITVTSVPGKQTQMNITLPLQEAGERMNEYHHINR